MTDTWELVGSIRKSLTAIRDHYDATLNGPRCRPSAARGDDPTTKGPSLHSQ